MQLNNTQLQQLLRNNKTSTAIKRPAPNGLQFPNYQTGQREREREATGAHYYRLSLYYNAMYIQKADRVGDHAKETDTHIRVFFFLFFAMESFRSSNSSAVEMMSDFFCLLGYISRPAKNSHRPPDIHGPYGYVLLVGG